MSQENVQVVRRMWEMFSAGDAEGVASLVSLDVDCFPARGELTPKRFRGREAFLSYAKDWMAGFSEYALEAGEFHDVGDCVIVVGRVVGRGRGSGAEVSADDAWLYRLKDGLVIEYRECGTKERALDAAGLSE
jgi:ketosteroid isomerase-like protein